MKTILLTKRITYFRILGVFILGLYCSSCGQASREKENDLKANALQKDTQFEKVETTEYTGSVIMKPEEGDVLWLKPGSRDSLGSGVELHIYMDAKDHPDMRASFAKVALGEGGILPAHKHERTEELAYILSGEGYVINYIDNKKKEIPIKEGYVWYNPPGVWHTFRNTGDSPLTLIMAVIPNEKDGLLSFFRKVGAKPGEDPGPITPEEFRELANKHDMKLMPPKEIE